ncbi:hypothetical protein [Streptomyces virginiae]|uniref:hypothetical protein n=1 Tax=Streptomyces virginiae TaxID=1961 RepID=UPI002255F317|nr:hypothetical protein [Streptomyces virginiae]MCX5177642.1 hypothetical protein [Streptomyces virginiae]
MNPKPYESHGAGDPTAVPAALGLGLLAVGGWLLTTARPWQKPGHPLTLGLGWTASGALLVCGLLLLARCVRTVHGRPAPGAALDADVPAPTEAGTGTDD